MSLAIVVLVLAAAAAIGYAAGVLAYRRRIARYRPALAACSGCWRPLFLDTWILMDEEGRMYCEDCARREGLVAQRQEAVDQLAN